MANLSVIYLYMTLKQDIKNNLLLIKLYEAEPYKGSFLIFKFYENNYENIYKKIKINVDFRYVLWYNNIGYVF